jgi:hypothetical protein
LIHILQSLHCAVDIEHNYKCETYGLFSYGFVLSKFLIVINLSFNFWCYCFFSEKFREVFKEIFCTMNKKSYK